MSWCIRRRKCGRRRNIGHCQLRPLIGIAGVVLGGVRNNVIRAGRVQNDPIVRRAIHPGLHQRGQVKRDHAVLLIGVEQCLGDAGIEIAARGAPG